MRHWLPLLTLALVLCVIPACSDDEGGTTNDDDATDTTGDTDALGDVAPDVAPDSVADTVEDTSSDVATDADAAPDGPDALPDTGDEVPDEGRGDVPDLPNEDADLADCGAAGCVSAPVAGSLTQTCPIVGNETPFTDDFAGPALSDRWSVFAVGSGSVTPGSGTVTTATGAVSSGGFSLAALLSVCSFPPQDFSVTGEVSVAGAGTGDFVVGLILQRGLPGSSFVVAAAQIGSEEPDGEIGFLDEEDGSPVESDITFPRDATFELRLDYTLSSGLTSATINPSVGDPIFDASTTFTTAPATLVPLLSIAAITAGSASTGANTNATASWSAFTSDLTGALPAFVGTDAPLVLDGRTFDSLGTHYLAGGVLTEIEVTDDVPGVDGVTDLNAALVNLGAAAITFYTDLDESALTTWLGDFDDGTGAVAAFRESVFVAQGAPNDYVFDEAALEP